MISKNCSIGHVKNVGVNHKNFDRIGFKCWLGKCLVIRGVIMNSVNYSRGVVRGEPQLIKKTHNPLDYLIRRIRKKNKYNDNLILRCSK